MTLFVGETVTITAVAFQPASGKPVTEATATVELYAPGLDPARVVEDRTPTVGPLEMAYDPELTSRTGSKGGFVAYVPTAGWDPGKWVYRVQLAGASLSWEYASFKLLA